MKDKEKNYVVLRHLTMPHKNLCFFTNNSEKGTECEYGINGERWYEIVGYADTVPEAQSMCSSNYGGMPSMKEFEDHAKEELKNQYGKTLDEF